MGSVEYGPVWGAVTIVLVLVIVAVGLYYENR